MFLRVATLLLSLSSLASAIEVSMIDMEDVTESHRIVTDSSNANGASPYLAAGNKGARGVSFIKSGLKKLLMKTANMDASFMDMDPSEWHEVQTTHLSGTSKYHQDHKNGCGSKSSVEDEVGFVALNTNNDAYFDHPEMSVPIRKGAFIRFKGSDPHRTVVNKGNVHLLGPFDLKTFGKVGDPHCCSIQGVCVYPEEYLLDETDQEGCERYGHTYIGGHCDSTPGICPSTSQFSCCDLETLTCSDVRNYACNGMNQARFYDQADCEKFCVEPKKGKAGKTKSDRHRRLRL